MNKKKKDEGGKKRGLSKERERGKMGIGVGKGTAEDCKGGELER